VLLPEIPPDVSVTRALATVKETGAPLEASDTISVGAMPELQLQATDGAVALAANTHVGYIEAGVPAVTVAVRPGGLASTVSLTATVLGK
jgi:hypothetical protein